MDAGFLSQFAPIYEGMDFSLLSQTAAVSSILSFVMSQEEADLTAAALIEQFGSVSSVMEAQEEDLLPAVNGNEQAAMLLKLAPEFGRYYYVDKLNGGRQFNNVDEIAEFCFFRFVRDTRETYSVMLLDCNMRMLGIVCLAEGTDCEVESKMEQLGSALFRFGASSFVLIHNHPERDVTPSESDVQLTDKIYRITSPFNKILTEHIIISNGRYLPIMQLMRKQGYEFYGL